MVYDLSGGCKYIIYWLTKSVISDLCNKTICIHRAKVKCGIQFAKENREFTEWAKMPYEMYKEMFGNSFIPARFKEWSTSQLFLFNIVWDIQSWNLFVA